MFWSSRRLTVTILASAMMLLRPALAEEADCTCSTPPADQGKVIGSITSSSGQVLASKDNGLAPAGPGTGLVYGSQVITGPASTANISVGRNCNLFLDQNSEVIISEIDQAICVQVTQAGTTPPPNVALNNLVPLVIIGGVVTGIALGGGDDSASD